VHPPFTVTVYPGNKENIAVLNNTKRISILGHKKTICAWRGLPSGVLPYPTSPRCSVLSAAWLFINPSSMFSVRGVRSVFGALPYAAGAPDIQRSVVWHIWAVAVSFICLLRSCNPSNAPDTVSGRAWFRKLRCVPVPNICLIFRYRWKFPYPYLNRVRLVLKREVYSRKDLRISGIEKGKLSIQPDRSLRRTKGPIRRRTEISSEPPDRVPGVGVSRTCSVCLTVYKLYSDGIRHDHPSWILSNGVWYRNGI